MIQRISKNRNTPMINIKITNAILKIHMQEKFDSAVDILELIDTSGIIFKSSNYYHMIASCITRKSHVTIAHKSNDLCTQRN